MESGCWGLIISMDDSKWLSLEQMRAFLAGAEPVEFCGQGRKEVYEWVERVLVGHEYAVLDKAGKGAAAALRGEDDGIEPGAGDAVDRGLSGDGAGPGAGV